MSEQPHTGFKVFRPRRGPTEDYVEPEQLFPRYHSIAQEHRRWEYVRDELVRMVGDGSLYLTDVLRQSSRVANMAADVIFGRCIEDHRQMQREVPEELLRHRVRVKSVCDETVRWCQDMVRGEAISKGANAGGFNGDDTPQQAYRVEEEWVDTGQMEAMLTLRQAVFCLKQAGKHVVAANRAGLQTRFWKFEEVKPEGSRKPDDKPEKGGRKSFAEANRQ